MTPDDDPRFLQLAADEMRRKCAADVLEYARFVRTRDESDSVNPIKRFPVEKDYVRQLLTDFSREPKIVIAKSRQVMATWSVCVFMTWWARFKPHQLVVLQTQGQDDADKAVSLASAKSGGYTGRCQLIEQCLPSWLRQDGITSQQGRIVYPNGSLIEGLPGGRDKIRGKTASIIVLDELAFLEDAKATYTSIAPLLQKGCRFLGISTPNGSTGNLFYHLFHGVPIVA